MLEIVTNYPLLIMIIVFVIIWFVKNHILASHDDIASLKQEIIDRLSKLQNEMKDMEDSVKSDVEDDNLRDEDMFRINEKIKDLEKQILNVIEG